MIEVFRLENGLFRWVMISETGLLQVVGDDHATDFLANAAAKRYRNVFRQLAANIDCYKNYL
jgi:hypothetical protein